MKKRLYAAFFVLLLLSFCFGTAYTYAGDVYSITVQGVINPPSAGFIEESLAQAEAKGAEAFLVLLDTPGGLDTSMREIVKTIMESKVPVIVYVSPSGARAASAGSIILLASHVAAMSPGTNVGAAHPVSIGKEKADKEMMTKVVNDAEAYVRSIAKKRGRNVEWAAKSVVESSSIAAADALKMKVIDVVAASVDELLGQVNGRAIEVKTGKVVLNTKGKKPIDMEMPFKYKFLSYISDPNVAYILMMIGIYGMLFEIYSPGAIFPGVAGGISLILALYAFHTIPINLAGLFLIILGIIFFVLELKIISHGVLGIAGIISTVIGSIMLIDLPHSILAISWKTIVAVAIVSGIFIFSVLSYAVKAQLSKVKTGREGLVGEEGVARTNMDNQGKIFVHGELWNAESNDPVTKGDQVVVTGVDGLHLKVRKKGGSQCQ